MKSNILGLAVLFELGDGRRRLIPRTNLAVARCLPVVDKCYEDTVSDGSRSLTWKIPETRFLRHWTSELGFQRVAGIPDSFLRSRDAMLWLLIG